MRRLEKQLLNALVGKGGRAALQQLEKWVSSPRPDPYYAALPARSKAAEEDLKRCEHEWRHAGSGAVTKFQVDQALQKATGLQSQFKKVKAQSRPSPTLVYLRLVRLFELTGLPRFGKKAVFMGSGAITCGLALLFSLVLFSSLSSFLQGSLALAICSFSVVAGAVFLFWPSETKRQLYQRLDAEWKLRKKELEALRPPVLKAWEDYNRLRYHWDLCNRVEEARQRRDELAAEVSSVKYQLIHTDWRALRGVDFETFLANIFELLGYQVQLTKASGDQGADLLVTGKGTKIAIQAKGYDGSVGNGAVQEVFAAMAFYQCSSCSVVTNSRFSRGAIELAQRLGCCLIEGARIPDLIEGRIY